MLISALVLGGAFLPLPQSHAQNLFIANPSFEDTSGQSSFNEFTFGTPAEWQLYNPDGIVGPGVTTGTLNHPETAFFNEPAPDGTHVLILFNSQQQGNGIYGFQQTLGDTLQADTTYQLSVGVGNIGSGTATNGQFFDLSGFPGYRVELLADPNPDLPGDEILLASDDNSLYGSIPEGAFATSLLTFNAGAAHPQLGQFLAIRLINLNQIPSGINPVPDLEVDFDNVQLQVVPEPNSLQLLLSGIFLLLTWTTSRVFYQGTKQHT